MGTLKIAVKYGICNSTSNTPQLLELNKDDNFIKSCIESCISKWNLEVPDDVDVTEEYALLMDNKTVTKNNLNTVKEGGILKFTYATKVLVRNILNNLETHGKIGSDALIERLTSNDNDFLDVLIRDNNGVSVILTRLCYDLDTHEDSPMINHLLEALCLIISQFSVSDKVLVEIEEKQDLTISLIEGMDIQNWNGAPKKWDADRLKQAAIFLTVIQKSSKCCHLVRKSVDVRRLIDEKILNKDIQRQVRINALALFNEIILNENEENREGLIELMEKSQMAQNLADEFINKDVLGNLLRKQLYYVQCWSLRKYQVLQHKIVKNEDGNALNMIKEIQKIAFNHDKQSNMTGKPAQINRRTQNYTEFKNLGFVTLKNPAQDFQEPPGMLALQLMHQFAVNNKDVFNKLVLESTYRGDGCPYARSSIGLVKILCDVFDVDKDPKLHQKPSDKTPVYKFIFKDLYGFFQAAFNASIEHLFLTWREMRASNTFVNDLDKVMDVTKDQILVALSNEPQTTEEFAKALPKFGKITDNWRERGWRKAQEDCEAIKELKKALKPDIMTLIYEQRLNFACQGTKFIKPGGKANKFIYMKLSANKKTICYGDWNSENEVPEIEDLTGKLLISDIKAFVSGHRIENVRSHYKGRADSTQPAERHMTIMTDTTQIEVIAPKDEPFHNWCDAINYLLGKDMETKKSSKVDEDIELLLGHEVRLRLLDLEDVKLPDKAPPIPPLPNPPIPVGIL